MSIVGIIVAILVLGVLIFTHEFGHFIMARIMGVTVTEFSIGFGPRLFSFHALGTIFSVKLIPLGGSCAMLGEDAAGGGDLSAGTRDGSGEAVSFDGVDPDNIPEDSFLAKRPWQKALIAFFGPFFNFVLAFVFGLIVVIAAGTNPPLVYATNDMGDAAGLKIGDRIVSLNGTHISTGADISLAIVIMDEGTEDFTVEYERDGVLMKTSYNGASESYRLGLTYYGNEELPATITALVVDGSAQKAGMELGDTVVEVDGTPISSGASLSEYFDEHETGAAPITVKVLRGEQEQTLVITPALTREVSLGFAASAFREDATFLTAIKGAFDEVTYGVKAVVYSFRMLFTGKAGINDMSGPVGIISIIGDTVEESASEGTGIVILNVLSIAILLSANLAVINLMPFPALDGGRLIVSIIEWITGKKIPFKVESIINLVGFALLLLLIIFITGHDIFKLFQ